jgi:hypothetical protein
VGIGAVRAALVVAAVLAFFYAVPAASSSPRAHGRELVAQYQLSAEAVARYATRDDATRERDSGLNNEQWVGPPQQAGAGRNPYTLVLTVSGIAKAAGDVRTHWQTGWEVRESPVATREVLMPVAGVSGRRVAAGAPVSLTAIGNPLSFRGERQVAPMLSLVNAHNVDIQDVHLQVWSGPAPLVAWPVVSRPALCVIGALCVLGWFGLRRGVRPAPAAKPSHLPEPDLQSLLEHRPVGEPPALAAATPATAALPTQSQAARVVAAQWAWRCRRSSTIGARTRRAESACATAARGFSCGVTMRPLLTTRTPPP